MLCASSNTSLHSMLSFTFPVSCRLHRVQRMYVKVFGGAVKQMVENRVYDRDNRERFWDIFCELN